MKHPILGLHHVTATVGDAQVDLSFCIGVLGLRWYPFSFMEEVAKNEPGISSGLQVLDQLVIDVVARGVRKEHIVLLGFSQGACLAAQFAG